MKLIDTVKQTDEPGGTLEIWLLNNGLKIGLWKDEVEYELFIKNDQGEHLTKFIYNKLNHPYNEIVIEYGSFFPPKIKLEHKYFEKFISLVENLSTEDLEADPFCG